MHTEEAYVTEALRLGVVKGAGTGEVLTGVRAVHNGDMFISPALTIAHSFTPGQEMPPTSGFDRLIEREVEVLKLVAAGNTSKEICEQLNIAGRTAETHRSHIFHKLGLSSHSDLVVYAVKHDLLTKSYQARVTACWHPRRSRPVVHRNRSSRHRPSTFGGQENHHFGKIHRCHP
jgi:DNA-binding NarL/FixJ family response regulator